METIINRRNLVNVDKDELAELQRRERALRSACQDIAELAVENGPEWASRRALRGLE